MDFTGKRGHGANYRSTKSGAGMTKKGVATMFCLTDAQVRYALYIHGQANKHTELHETELESKREKDFISKYFRKLWFKS